MQKLKIRAHTCYLGKTGYNAHARGFFRALAQHVDLRVRNYTWDENPDYLNEVDLSILDTITLSTGHDRHADFPIADQEVFQRFNFTTPKTPFQPDVDIVLMDMNHHYFYEKYDAPLKIAYTVWESTRLPNYFVEQLIQNFDAVWVVTEWHRQVLSDQGYPISRIHVVNEAVDEDFVPAEFDPNFQEYSSGDFIMSIFGRWDFRKSVPEMISAFLEEFRPDEPVKLVLSVDNPYAVDGMNSTEERMNHYGFVDDRIKIKHFVNRQDYIKYIQNGHLILTCARAEGWNIPLLEAMAAGTPALYTDYGAQLEFASGKGIPVKITGMVECLSGDTYNVQALAGTEVPGYYASPDYQDFKKQMRYAYENYSKVKAKAVAESQELREKFTWENAAYQALNFIQDKIAPQSEKQTNHSGECVVVLSHADTRVKEMKMHDLVDLLQRKGYPTILSTHLNEVSSADFTIIDAKNFVINQELAQAYSFKEPDFDYEDANVVDLHMPYLSNCGPAIFALVKNGLDFAFAKGYEIVHFVNYDYYIQNIKVLQSTNTMLQNVDLVGYESGVPKGINTGFFSCKSKVLKSVFDKIETVQDYYKHGILFEEVLTNLIKENQVDFIKLPNIDDNEIITNTKIFPEYLFFKLDNKRELHYTITLDEATNQVVLSFFGVTDYPVEVRIKKGKRFYKFYLKHNTKHCVMSQEFFRTGFEIYLPSFEQSAWINSQMRLGKVKVVNWDNIEKLEINKFVNASSLTRKIIVHSINGPFVEITDSIYGNYRVEFIDNKTNKTIYSTKIENNCWTKVNREWYTEWRIKITDLIEGEIVYDKILSLENKRVFICFDSSSLGDTIAWVGYAEEFRKKHNCHVIVSTFHNELFTGQYPDLEFVGRGVSVPNIFAQYNIGWFYDGDKTEFDERKHPSDFRNQEMQKTAADILGLEFKQIRPKLAIPQRNPSIEGKYVCVGIHSTAQAKYWNYPGGWQKVVDFLNEQGYKVVLISREEGEYMGNVPPTGIIDKTGPYDFADRIIDLRHADFYIGMGSGLSWLAWAAETPTVLISGFSDPKTEFVGDDVVRIFNPEKCNSCFNRYRLDAGDWNWCPDFKNTPRMFECSTSITPEAVIQGLTKFLK